MTTVISDDELFAYAERAKGKVVVLTGASRGPGWVLERALRTPRRRCEWYWKGSGFDLREVWVSGRNTWDG